MSTSRRQKRVSEEIRRSLATIFLRDYGDTAVGHVVITGVHVSPDLRQADVLFRTLTEDGRAYVIRKLREEKKQIRYHLASAIKHMRRIPELTFSYDTGLDKINRIDELLNEDDDGREQ